MSEKHKIRYAVSFDDEGSAALHRLSLITGMEPHVVIANALRIFEAIADFGGLGRPKNTSQHIMMIEQ